MRKIAVLTLLLVLVVVSSVYAISGRIGNGKMFLKAEVSDDEPASIEKYILVRNVNDISVKIQLVSDGNIKDFITITDKEFVLAPGQDRKANFIINVEQPGLYEGRINVYFSAFEEKGPGVVLSSQISLDVSGDGERIVFPEVPIEEIAEDTIPEDTETISEAPVETTDSGEDVTGVSVSIENRPEIKQEKKFNNASMLAFGLSFAAIILFFVLILLFNLYGSKKE